MIDLARLRITVWGLGLMGGSLAQALRSQAGEIAGWDIDPATVQQALTAGVIDRVLAPTDRLTTDLLILAAPARAIVRQLADLRAAEAPNPVVTLDIGSTKQHITAALNALPAWADPLGGHPMCGKETGGLAHADPTLYRGAPFVLTPLERTSPRALAVAQALARALGAHPILLDPATHDVLVAYISHVPYLSAVALVNNVAQAGDERAWRLLAGGFRDSTRIAAKDIGVMGDILRTNRAAVLAALDAFLGELAALKAALDAPDEAALDALLSRAQRARLTYIPPLVRE